MKKVFCLLLLTCMAVVLSGCASGYIVQAGHHASFPGMILNNQTMASLVYPKAESLKDVEILGPVTGESTSMDVLFLMTTGDCGFHQAKMNALQKYPQADDVINVEIDSRHESILCIFNKNTTILHGIAIRYKR